MKSTFLKIITLFSLLAAPKIFAQSRTTNFFAAPQDSQSPLIIATDASSVCVGVTYVHPETGVIVTGTAAAGNSCLGKQQNQKPTCNADGQRDCVIADDGKFSAVDAASSNSKLEPGNIRRGYIVGGITGTFPSAATPLHPGTTPPAISTSNVTKTAPKDFLLFGTDGKPYQFRVGKISVGEFFDPLQTKSSFLSAPTNTLPTSTSPTTLYLPFKISGDSNLSEDNILIPNTVLGIKGTSLPRNTFKSESTDLVEVKDSLNAVKAKATVFIDYPTQNRWILLRDETSTTNRLAKTYAEASALCTGAKVTLGSNTYSSSTGTWALPTSNQVAWMLKTGATGPDGLITKEGIFGSKFWVSDNATYKTAYFPDAITDPDIETPAVTTANVICVFQFTPPKPTNLVATPAAGQVVLTWISGGGTTVGYRVSYQTGSTAPTTCSAGTAVLPDSINLTGTTISGLTDGTEYTFLVCAMSSNSYGTPLYSAGATTSATPGIANAGLGGNGGGGGTSFTLKTGTDPVLFVPDGMNVTLAAHVYLDPQNTRAFAYVFRSIENVAIAFPYSKYSASTQAAEVCGDLKAQMQTSSILPTEFAAYDWKPISKTLVEAFAPGFTVAPFLGSVADGKYPLEQNFLAFDNTVSDEHFKVYKFSTVGGGASEASAATEGAVICTAGQ